MSEAVIARPTKLESLFETRLVYILFGLFTVFALASEVGYQIGHSLVGKENVLSEAIPTAIMGLLALLLGFTYSMTVARFEMRQQLVIKEANAISTFRYRTQLMREPYKTQLDHLLKPYIKDVVLFFHRRDKVADLALQQQLWDVVSEAAQEERGELSSLLVQSFNEMVDLFAEVEHAYALRVPEVIYVIISLIAFLGMITLAFIIGYNENSHLPIFVLAFLLSLTIVMIRDIDEPDRGLIRVKVDSLLRCQG